MADERKIDEQIMGRIVSPDVMAEEHEELSLRPTSLSEYIGQRKSKII